MDKYYKELVDNVDELMIVLAKNKDFKGPEFEEVRTVLKKLGRSRLQYKRQFNERFRKAV